MQLINTKQFYLWREYPEGLDLLPSLEDLMIYMPPTELGDLGKLKRLKNIHFYHEAWTHFPEEITKSQTLEQLSFTTRQPLEKLPQDFSKMKALKSLRIHSDGFKVIPDSVADLESLETLDLYGNAIEQLPKAMGKLSNLKVLNLEHNAISHLPKSMGKLPKVESINLDRNKIDAFLAQIPSQNQPNLSDNLIDELDLKSLSKFPALEELIIRNNPLFKAIRFKIAKYLPHLKVTFI